MGRRGRSAGRRAEPGGLLWAVGLALAVGVSVLVLAQRSDGPTGRGGDRDKAEAEAGAAAPVHPVPELAEPRIVGAVFKPGEGNGAAAAAAPRLTLEVVDTPEATSRGLMYRTTMPPDDGMLFVFPEPRELSFWMRNTFLPLSIAFVDARGTVADVLDMAPLDEGPRYRSSRPCRYAIEVNQGWFARRGVRPGDRVVFLYETPSVGRR